LSFNQFNNSHWSGITHPRPKLDYPCIATRSALHARSNIREQTLNRVLVGKIRKGKPAMMDGWLASKGNQLLGRRANGLGLRLGGRDSIVEEECADKAPVECYTLVCRPAKLLPGS